MATYEPTFPTCGWHLFKTFKASKFLTCLTTENVYSYSYVEGESTTQTGTGMSKIIEEGPICFPKTSAEKKNIYMLSKV